MPPSQRDDYLALIERRGVSPGLERIRAACAALGDPQKQWPAVIVAGTNGKGSVATLVSLLARAHGIRTGLYTSPHLTRVNERIALDGVEIGDDELDALVLGLRDAGERFALTYFEFLTLAAFVHFAARGVGLAVLEVGMGGRLDATNAVDARVAVVTPVALDHTADLGPDVGSIAREKAGVLRRGATAITARQEPAAAAVIEAIAAALPCPLVREGDAFSWDRRPAGGLADPEVFDYRSPGADLRGLRLGLKGLHQPSNASLALAAFHAVARTLGVTPDEGRIRASLAEASWPGRFQVFEGDPPIVLDGAHNPHGAAALRAALGERAAGRPVHLVFGALEDKDYRQMASILAGAVADVMVVRPDSARAAPVDGIAAAFRDCGVTASAVGMGIGEALDQAAARAKKTGGLVVASGSLYLVGMAIRALSPR